MQGQQHSTNQRFVELRATPESARQARRAVAATCANARTSDDMAATAVLLTDELVTNAIVHARTDIGVTITATSTGVSVQVLDHSPHLPSRRTYDETASTGRGMELVQLLADDHGAFANSAGKIVWFVLGDGHSPVAASADALPASPVATTAVQLRGVPVPLYCTWQQHADALLREYVLVCFDEHAQSPLLGSYRAARDALSILAEQAGDVFAARDSGPEHMDVSVDVPAAAAKKFRDLATVLDSAARMAAAGQLLVPPSQPEIVALRTWCCTEVLRQSSGLPPHPWDVKGLGDAPLVGTPVQWDATEVVGASAAMIAADDTNRIVAVSPALADLLGWEPDALPGRRLITIIPQRYHERHIAGFVRHLLTGEERILDRTVRMPARHRDGHDVPVDLVIHKVRSEDGRAVFVATLQPAE